MKLKIIEKLQNYCLTQGLMFTSEEDAEEYYKGLVEIIEELVIKDRKKLIKEIESFPIMQKRVIDKLEEITEDDRVTNLLNENLEIGYRQACFDILKVLKNKN